MPQCKMCHFVKQRKYQNSQEMAGAGKRQAPYLTLDWKKDFGSSKPTTVSLHLLQGIHTMSEVEDPNAGKRQALDK